MTIEEASLHSGYVQCAWLYLRRYLKRPIRNREQEDPENVALCVKKGFSGDIDAFVEWADEYLRDGIGISG